MTLAADDADYADERSLAPAFGPLSSDQRREAPLANVSPVRAFPAAEGSFESA